MAKYYNKWERIIMSEKEKAAAKLLDTKLEGKLAKKICTRMFSSRWLAWCSSDRAVQL